MRVCCLSPEGQTVRHDRPEIDPVKAVPILLQNPLWSEEVVGAIKESIFLWDAGSVSVPDFNNAENLQVLPSNSCWRLTDEIISNEFGKVS